MSERTLRVSARMAEEIQQWASDEMSQWPRDTAYAADLESLLAQLDANTASQTDADTVAAPDYKGFTQAIMEDWQEHGDIDAATKFDLAVKHRILREIPGGYDPGKHIDAFGDYHEMGDPWYEWNDAPDATAAQPATDAVAAHCRCICHRQKGVTHITPCCDQPPFNPFAETSAVPQFAKGTRP